MAPFMDATPAAELTGTELAAFKAIRTEIDTKWTHLNKSQTAFLTDECILRYLRARKYVAAAKNLLVDTLDFRIDEKPHKIKADSQMSFGSHLSNYFHMTDVHGHPVCYLRFRRDPTSGFTPKDRIRYVMFTIEEGIRIIKKNKEKYPGIEKMIYLIDLQEFSMSAPGADIGVSKEWGTLMSAKYPERMYRAYLMNYPGIFSTFWSLISAFMAKSQVDKVRWVPDHKTKAERSEYFKSEGFDLDMLEEDFGGNVPALDKPNFTGDTYKEFPMKK